MQARWGIHCDPVEFGLIFGTDDYREYYKTIAEFFDGKPKVIELNKNMFDNRMSLV